MMRIASLYSKFKRPLCGVALLLLAGCAFESEKNAIEPPVPRNFEVVMVEGAAITSEMSAVCDQIYSTIPHDLGDALSDTVDATIPNLTQLAKSLKGKFEAVDWEPVSAEDYEYVGWLTHPIELPRYLNSGTIMDGNKDLQIQKKSRARNQNFNVDLKNIDFRKFKVPDSFYTLYRKVERGVDVPSKGPYPQLVSTPYNPASVMSQYPHEVEAVYFNDAFKKNIPVDLPIPQYADIVFQKSKMLVFVHAFEARNIKGSKSENLGQIIIRPFYFNMPPGANPVVLGRSWNPEDKYAASGPLRPLEVEGCELTFNLIKED